MIKKFSIMKCIECFKIIILLKIIFFISFFGCSEKRNTYYASESSCEASSCHEAVPNLEYPPNTGKHDVHLSKGNTCDNCHNEFLDHVYHKNGKLDVDNGSITVYFDRQDASTKWANLSSDCSYIECHGGGSNPVNWYAESEGCTTCHSSGSIFDPLITNGNDDKGKHISHVTNAGIDCIVCHDNYSDRDTHINGIYGKAESDMIVYFDSSNSTASWDDNITTCSNMDCHGNVDWYTTEQLSCLICHTAGSSIDPTSIGSHSRHIEIGYDCTNCHSDYLLENTHRNGVSNNATIAPGMINFDDTLNPAGSYAAATTTCNSLYCHGASHPGADGSDTDPEWSPPSTVGCGSCHATVMANKTSTSHPTHNNSAGKGPGVGDCSDCHMSTSHVGNVPDGILDFIGDTTLASTSICDTCHSPDGEYNGVDSTNGSIGAKDHWESGVYNGSVLETGNEKWCIGCHDDVPANSLANGSGIDAPNTAGDNNTYGFYVTGHASELCTDCHDSTIDHIDGVARTYTAPSDIYLPGTYYQDGYRLKSISAESPMVIPYRSVSAGVNVNADDFRLCFSCHDSTPFTSNTVGNNNFWDADPPGDPAVPSNYHYLHLTSQHNPDIMTCGNCHTGGALAKPWDSDWDGARDSDVSCPACHNVHGSKSPAMIRSGELIGHEPGLNFKYLDNASGNPWNFKDPQTVDGSTGGAFDLTEAPGPIATLGDNGICLMCHDQRVGYYRNAP